MRRFYSLLLSALLACALVGFSACGGNNSDTADITSMPDPGNPTPDPGNPTPDPGNPTPDLGNPTPDEGKTPPVEPEECHCDPIEESLLCIDSTVFIYGNFGSGECGQCYGQKELVDCPFGCNFQGTLHEIPFIDPECVDWDMCPIDACYTEKEACIDSGFAWFSDLCCSPPGSPEDPPDCDEISHCREPCSKNDDCADAARPFCCPEYVCPNNEDYSIPDCSIRSCVEHDCTEVLNEACGGN